MSPRQKYVLDKYRIRYDDTWTRGMAADALTKVFAKKRIKTLTKNFDPEQWRKVLATDNGKVWLTQRIERFRTYAESVKAVAQ
ncbi:hypothetical protein [Alicyclobacillus herbarius]|uniref:hypothetical protein n=1 Tax=Alicyclobacillus herbarius TaxID=122960 RepID=UPI00041ED93E|nr:hypothetical protein [Alicyclobacillus herbarius]